MNDKPNDEPRVANSAKKTYEKPSFRFEQVFVTSALACTKLGTEANCQLQGHTSVS